jgi:lysophospholipase L1-like esterase
MKHRIQYRITSSFSIAGVLALCACWLLAGCSPAGEEPAPEAQAAPLSIVVLGDSVASGEGINYGYKYSTSFPNRWYGGTDNPTWEPPYPLCHDSKLAYGNLVASQRGASLAKFACTGSTYENGIIGERIVGSEIYRPAQFGDWANQTQLNQQYDEAKPDVVIVTLGADDVHFVDILTYCATGYTADDADLLTSISAAESPGAHLREEFVRRFPTPEALQAAREVEPQAPEGWFDYCTAANPGPPIEKLFWGPVRNGTLTAHYQALVQAIQERGRKDGKVPEILFTTYHNPLPGPSESIDCLDLGDLSRAEIDYLITLEQTLGNVIQQAVQGLEGVTVADLFQVMDGHKFCTSDPWTYGLSILWLNSSSQAPFHPTPAGQQAIAALVEKAMPASASQGAP